MSNSNIISEASQLLSDDWENPEYDRALAELVIASLGLSQDTAFALWELLGRKFDVIAIESARADREGL